MAKNWDGVERFGGRADVVVERIFGGRERRKSGFGGLKVHVTQIAIVAIKVEWVLR